MTYSIVFCHRTSYKSGSCRNVVEYQGLQFLVPKWAQFSWGRISCTRYLGSSWEHADSRATDHRGRVTRCSGLADNWNFKICPGKEPLKCFCARFLLDMLYFPCWITALGNLYSAHTKNMGKLLIWAWNLYLLSPASTNAYVAAGIWRAWTWTTV